MKIPSLLLCLTVASQAAIVISEFEPNPTGADPDLVSFEISGGNPNTAFSGFLSSIDTDPGSALGFLNSVEAVSGIFDSAGFLVLSIADLENPSFVLVLSDTSPGAAGDSVDVDQDGSLDSIAPFGTVYDAIGVIDATDDARSYASELGGSEFATANEWEIAFRDGATGNWYGVDTFSETVFDIAGNEVLGSGAGTFSSSPLVTSFGSANPEFSPVPEPSAVLLGGLALLGLLRRRR